MIYLAPGSLFFLGRFSSFELEPFSYSNNHGFTEDFGLQTSGEHFFQRYLKAGKSHGTPPKTYPFHTFTGIYSILCIFFSIIPKLKGEGPLKKTPKTKTHTHTQTQINKQNNCVLHDHVRHCKKRVKAKGKWVWRLPTYVRMTHCQQPETYLFAVLLHTTNV